MRCPKCHYLSFEPEPRCKNCGYDLAVEEGELIVKTVDEAVPLADLTLREPIAPRRAASAPLRAPRAAASVAGPLVGGVALADAPTISIPPPMPAMRHAAPAAPPAAARNEDLETFVSETPVPPSMLNRQRPEPPRPAHPTSELPLFVKAMPQEVIGAEARPESDEPLVKVPAEPRPPLVVRRSSADAPKPRTTTGEASRSGRKLGPFDRDLLDDLRRVEKEEARQARAEARAVAAETGADQVGRVRRLIAAAIDVVLLAAMSAGVMWVTFRLVGLSPTAVGASVLVPLAAFVLLLDLGYLVMFTAAGGQTVGKMLTGIRVIGTTHEDAVEDRVTLGQAIYRELLTLPLLLPLGAGLLPVLFGNGLAVHDRLAHTRVVRA